MELFRSVNVDWMGKAKYFAALSALLLIVGWASVIRSHGLNYGIDFRGGTLVYVRFASAPPIDQIRKGLTAAGLANSSIQQISDISDASSKNDVVIGLEQEGQGDEALDAGKQKIVDILHSTFGGAETGKSDFNSVTPTDLGTFLTQKDPSLLGANSADRYNQLAQRLTDARDKTFGGIVTNFDQLKGVDGATPTVLGSLSSGFSLGGFTI